MHFVSKYNLLTLACCLSIVFASCEDPQDPNTPQNPSNPPTLPTEKPMSPSEQKQYLETVGLQLLEYFEESKFSKLTDLLSYANKTYSNYSWDNVSSWANDIYDDLIEASGTSSETDEYGYTNYYNNYKVLIIASNFHSRFVAQNNTWVRYDSNDLQFQFKDQYDRDCILKLTTSGNIKNVHVANIDDWYNSGNNSSYYDKTLLTIGIPEQVILTLTCGENVLLKQTVNIDLTSITNEQFDFSKSSININSIIELYNGYKFELSQASYTPNNLRIDFNLSSNGKSIINMTASSDISDIPSIKLEDLYSFDEDNYDFSNTSASNAYARIDILGKVQIQEEISEVKKYIEYLYSADTNNTNESNFKSYINQANALTKLYVYYNGTETIQASVKLEAFVESGFGSNNNYWYYEPVFEFFDGSSYCSLEAFFYDTDFLNVINTYKQIIKDYSNKFDY